MEEIKERAVRVVRKLLERTTERGCTPAEAAGAALKAKELLEQHQLSLLDVKAGRLNEDMAEELIHTGRNRRNTGEDVLAEAIGRGCGCQVVSSHRTGLLTLNFLGYKSDVQVARYLYSTLLDALLVKATSDANKARVSGAALVRWRNNYLMGAANEIRVRLQTVREQEKPEVQQEEELPTISKEQRYALVSVKQPEVEKFVKSVFPKLNKGRAGYINNVAAYERGREAGRNVPIRRGVEGVPTKFLKSGGNDA